MNISKLSINDLLNLDIVDFNSLTEKEMRKVVSRLRDAGNKKIKRLEKSGFDTPALRQVNRSGGLFSTKGKSLNQLRAEHSRIRSFMQSKTSTKTGFEKVRKETMKELEQSGVNFNLSEDRLKELLLERGLEVTPKNLKAINKELNSPDEKLKRMDSVLRGYEELKKMDPSVANRSMKYSIMAEVSKVAESGDMDRIMENMQDRIEAIYEEQARTSENFASVSEFFES